jgi:hypothetical protein
MTAMRLIVNGCVAAALIAASILPVPSLADGRFESINASATTPRMKEVAEAVQADDWPRSDRLRVAPPITIDKLTDPSAVTRRSTDYSTYLFKDNAGASVRWNWSRLIENPAGVPTELPESLREAVLRVLTDEQRNDPDLVEQRLQRFLKGYQESHRHILAGSVMIDMCRAPDARTAQDFLITLRCNTTFPTEGIIRVFSDQSRIEDLGDVAFGSTSSSSTSSSVKFVRDNIAVSILAHGEFAKEGLALARKIDAMIQEQPPVTKEQLAALHPVVSIGGVGRRSEEVPRGRVVPGVDRRRFAVDYTFSMPANQKIAHQQAFWTPSSGTRAGAGIRDGKIEVVALENTGTIRVEIITTGLLATTAEQKVTFLDEPPPQ